MSNPKFKVENYSNLGGINSKFSPHLTTPLEFLDIKNFDFQTPGELSQRWGTTQYMGQTMAGKITALSEFQRLDGTSMIITGSSGGLWHGATTGNFQGMSFTTIGVTRVSFGVTGGVGHGTFDAIGWQRSGTSLAYAIDSTSGVYYQGSSLQYCLSWSYQGSSTISGIDFNFTAPGQVIGGNYTSICYLVNSAFLANGNCFVRFDGTTTTNVGMPLPTRATLTQSYTETANASLIGFGGTGIAVFYASYVNNRGFESNIFPLASVLGPANGTSITGGAASGIIAMTMTLNTPLGYGISTINIYSYCIQGTSVNSAAPNSQFADPDMWTYPFIKLNSWPASGSTVTSFPLGTTLGNIPQIFNNAGQLSNPYSNQYQPLGLTLGPVTTSQNVRNTYGGTSINQAFRIDGYSTPYVAPFYPQFLDTFDNRLFCAGFSSAPSTVWFSDVKEPEGFLPGNNFEVRTNDADYITAMKSYQTRLYIFKRNSFHVLAGDNPDNFFVQEISPIYGCLNNRSVVIFENVMFFLDRKGVIEYTGSNISFASVKIQPIFDRMNYNAALTEACAGHDKLRNQVLFAIPVDGSTTNNITLVYDYVARAWTTHEGYNPRIFAEIQGYNTVRRLFHGDYSGRVNWHSASFLGDNGSAMTLTYKTRYLHDMGDSVQKQFRRLYVNADSLGTTLSCKINFSQDYGTSTVLGTTLNLGSFQERIDYGISAKSLAYQFIANNTTSTPLKIHGFTIESRMQRKV